jgi:hypothetical protein
MGRDDSTGMGFNYVDLDRATTRKITTIAAINCEKYDINALAPTLYFDRAFGAFTKTEPLV